MHRPIYIKPFIISQKNLLQQNAWAIILVIYFEAIYTKIFIGSQMS